MVSLKGLRGPVLMPRLRRALQRATNKNGCGSERNERESTAESRVPERRSVDSVAIKGILKVRTLVKGREGDNCGGCDGSIATTSDGAKPELVWISKVYKEHNNGSANSRSVNWHLMHRAVSDKLFMTVVKKATDTREVAAAFNLPLSVVEKNLTAASAENLGKRDKALTERERLRRIASFSKPVNAGEVAAKLYRHQSDQKTADVEEDNLDILCIDAELDMHSGQTFAAEVFVDKLKQGEVCVHLEAGENSVDVYSNGEVFIDGRYHGCSTGFGSKSTLKFVLESSTSLPPETFSQVTSESDDSLRLSSAHQYKESNHSGDGALLRVDSDESAYYALPLPRAVSRKNVQLLVSYPRSGRVGLHKLVEEGDEELDPVTVPSVQCVNSVPNLDVGGILSPVVAI